MADRIFNPRPSKHFRKAYSRAEAKVALVILPLLAAVGAWVRWEGVHPDLQLLAAADPQALPPALTVDRSPLPSNLAPPGWTEDALSRFGPDNVYEKIDGREGFYKSFGFQTLTFARYLDSGDAMRSVDVEAYDLGEAANALGCLASEAGGDASATVLDGGLVRADANARYLSRDRFYLRLVASDAEPASLAALEHLQAAMVTALPGGDLPWSFGLFAGLGVSPARISYLAEYAFSLEAGTRLHVGRLDDDGTVLFVSAAPADAAERAEALMAGFAQLGEPVPDAVGRTWLVDRYQSRASIAVAASPFVAGVYSAAGPNQGATALESLLAALGALPGATRALALAEGAGVPGEGESSGGGSGGYEEGSTAKDSGDEYGAEQ